jgi:hypothetical protein
LDAGLVRSNGTEIGICRNNGKGAASSNCRGAVVYTRVSVLLFSVHYTGGSDAQECAGCARQTSVTAGTVIHSSHLPLRTRFLAAHIITSHSNGMLALQLPAQLGLGGYKMAWLLSQKLRRSMVNPDRNPLKDLV